MAAQNCKHFSGYKPCSLNTNCSSSCSHFSEVQGQILIVHLEALGAVLRTTSILTAVKRKYPNYQINWVTKASAKPLLLNNPFIDRVFTLSEEDQLKLSTLKFEQALVIDKSMLSYGITKKLDIKRTIGFGVNPVTGAIEPLNQAAQELYDLGLSNQKKFFENKKPETQLMIEAFELGDYYRDEYILHLTQAEVEESSKRRQHWIEGSQFLIGINVGCSNVILYKKLGVEQHKTLIRKIKQRYPHAGIVLLGGSEDLQSSIEISKAFTDQVIVSDHNSGLRDGCVSMNACDIIVSGDSLGMHIGIALKKWVVAWFGPTCAHEIDLYDRGVKVLSKVSCGPCWKRSCQNKVMCYDQVSTDEIISAVEQGIQWQMSLSKQHSLGTSY